METFSVEPGWGDDGYIAVLANGRRSNQYKAINHSIAWDKALMAEGRDSEIKEIYFNGQKVAWRNHEMLHIKDSEE